MNCATGPGRPSPSPRWILTRSTSRNNRPVIRCAVGLIAAVLAAASLAAPSATSRAQNLMQQGRYAEAVRLLTPLAAASPKDANLLYHLGLAHQRSGNLQPAASAFHRAHLVRPKEAVYVAALARLYASTTDYERASFWYRKLLILRPNKIELVNEAADYALQQDRPLDAELILKKALKTTPQNPDGWILLGRCYEGMKLHAEAARAYERAATFQVPSGADLQQIIALQMQAGQPDRALPYLQTAEQADPRNPALRAQVAECYLAVGNKPAAIAAYRQAITLAPRNTAYRLALAPLLTDEDPAGALQEYQSVLAVQQPTETLLVSAAGLASKLGQTATALDYLTRLVALKPQEPSPRESLIQAALAAGDAATAVIQWRELQRAGQGQYTVDESELALRLGARQWALGRVQEIAPDAGKEPALAARLAMLAAELDDAPLATSLALSALQGAASQPDLSLIAAQALLQARQPDRAEPAFRKLVGQTPPPAAAFTGLARCHLAQNRVHDAYDLLVNALRQGHYDAAALDTLTDVAAQLDRLPQTGSLLLELLRATPERQDLLDGLCSVYRREGGQPLVARRLGALTDTNPQQSLWAMTAAREFIAAGNWRDAVTIYERLAKGSEYTVAARTGLCEVLLAEQRYSDLINALARLTGPQALGAEPYRLLLAARADLIVKGESAVNLPAVAAAVTALALSTAESEQYYSALADLYIAAKQPEQGLAFLQGQLNTSTATPGAANGRAACTLGLSRLLRKLDRPREALVWLDRLPLPEATPAGLLERAQCLIGCNLANDATLFCEQVLRLNAPATLAEAHRVAAEAAVIGSRPEEALWHFSGALVGGAPPSLVLPRMVSLCTTQPLSESAVISAIKDLYAKGQTVPALELADTLSNRPGYADLRRWAASRIAATLSSTP
ncbi:MAG: tetratricopeptide repeat protein [Armatimonadia bacterium]